MTAVSLYEAMGQLSQLVERAAAGEEIVISQAGRPMARLVPLAGEQPPPVAREPRKFGQFADVIEIGPEFDDPLPEDMQRAFEGEMP